MLTFMQQLFCHRQQAIPQQAPISTTIFYQRNNIPYMVELVGGPGGVVNLDEEQTQALLVSIDPQHDIGAISAELTASQLQNNELIQQIMSSRTGTKLGKK